MRIQRLNDRQLFGISGGLGVLDKKEDVTERMEIKLQLASDPTLSHKEAVALVELTERGNKDA